MQLKHLANFTAHRLQQNVVLKRFTTSHQNLWKEITTFINCSALCFCLFNTITSYNHRSPEDLNATCIRLYLSSAIWSAGWPLRMFWNLNFEPVPPLEAPRGTLHFTDTYSESERAKKCKQSTKCHPQNAQKSSKIFWWSNSTSKGCLKKRSAKFILRHRSCPLFS